jgi:O-antigen ligase
VFLLVPKLTLAGFMPLLIAFAPILLITLLGILANTDLLTLLSREGSNAYTATGRLFIWHAVYESVLSHPSSESFFGWGAYGQIRSGALLHYSFLDPVDPLLSAHSFTLQTILDAGYIGLVVALSAVAVGAQRLSSAARSAAGHTALLAILAVLFFSGTTESMPTFLDPAGLGLAFLILGVASVELRPSVPSRAEAVSLPLPMTPDDEAARLALRMTTER